MTMLLPNNFSNETLDLMLRDINEKIDELEEKNESYNPNVERRNGLEELIDTYYDKKEVIKKERQRREEDNNND